MISIPFQSTEKVELGSFGKIFARKTLEHQTLEISGCRDAEVVTYDPGIKILRFVVALPLVFAFRKVILASPLEILQTREIASANCHGPSPVPIFHVIELHRRMMQTLEDQNHGWQS